MTREPLVAAGAASSVAGAIVVVGALFGLHLTDAQAGAVATLVVLAAPLVTAAVARRHVTPTADPVSAHGVPLVEMVGAKPQMI